MSVYRADIINRKVEILTKWERKRESETSCQERSVCSTLWNHRNSVLYVLFIIYIHAFSVGTPEPQHSFHTLTLGVWLSERVLLLFFHFFFAIHFWNLIFCFIIRCLFYSPLLWFWFQLEQGNLSSQFISTPSTSLSASLWWMNITINIDATQYMVTGTSVLNVNEWRRQNNSKSVLVLVHDWFSRCKIIQLSRSFYAIHIVECAQCVATDYVHHHHHRFQTPVDQIGCLVIKCGSIFSFLFLDREQCHDEKKTFQIHENQ